MEYYLQANRRSTPPPQTERYSQADPKEDQIYMEAVKQYQERHEVGKFTALGRILYNALRDDIKGFMKGYRYERGLSEIKPDQSVLDRYEQVDDRLHKMASPVVLEDILKNLRHYVNNRDSKGDPATPAYLEKLLRTKLGSNAKTRQNLYDDLKQVFDLKYKHLLPYSQVKNAIREIHSKKGEARKLNRDDFSNSKVFDSIWHSQGGSDEWFKYLQKNLAPPNETTRFMTFANIKTWFEKNVYPNWSERYGATHPKKITLLGRFAKKFYPGKKTTHAQQDFMSHYLKVAENVRFYEDWLLLISLLLLEKLQPNY